MKLYEVAGPGHYLGTTSVVIADNEVQALALARASLVQHGISDKHIAETKVMRELRLDVPMCYVLQDGDY